uniref:Uncharacterized protein n=1 Tax=Glycine max TaxID=3847 RepID=C6TET9_SOYBN|nr:unknown [Glycine max]
MCRLTKKQLWFRKLESPPQEYAARAGALLEGQHQKHCPERKDTDSCMQLSHRIQHLMRLAELPSKHETPLFLVVIHLSAQGAQLQQQIFDYFYSSDHLQREIVRVRIFESEKLFLFYFLVLCCCCCEWVGELEGMCY